MKPSSRVASRAPDDSAPPYRTAPDSGSRTSPSPSAGVKRRTQRALVLVISPHLLIAEGLASLFRLVRSVRRAECTLPNRPVAAADFSPDVLVIEFDSRGGVSLSQVKELRTNYSKAKMCLLIERTDTYLVERLLQNGVQAICFKSTTPATLGLAVEHLLQGKPFLCNETRTAFSLRSKSTGAGAGNRNPDRPAASYDPYGAGEADRTPSSLLSDRELEIFGLVGKAMTTRQIADHLFISHKTVEAHKENIKGKLNLQSAAELARSAALWSSY